MVAYWAFDEADGATVKDSANDHKGTIKGNAVFEEGKIGNALSFDGVDDYVTFSQSTVDEFGSLEQGTIAFWFKYTSLLDVQTVMPLFYFGINEANNNDNIYLIEIGHSAGDGMTDQPDPNDKKIYSTWIKNHREPFLCFDSTSNVEEGEWHHFAVTVDANGNTGYLDGAEITNRDYNFGSNKATSFLSAIPVKEMLTLGYGRSSFMISPDFVYYKGLMDEVRVYNRALSSSEINELAEN